MNQKEINKATEIAKTVEGRMFEGVSQLDVDLVQAGYAQALKDVGEMLGRHSCQITGADVGHWGQILSNEVVEALKRGEMPKEINTI